MQIIFKKKYNILTINTNSSNVSRGTSSQIRYRFALSIQNSTHFFSGLQFPTGEFNPGKKGGCRRHGSSINPNKKNR